jgi:hypothetical protein
MAIPPRRSEANQSPFLSEILGLRPHPCKILPYGQILFIARMAIPLRRSEANQYPF